MQAKADRIHSTTVSVRSKPAGIDRLHFSLLLCNLLVIHFSSKMKSTLLKVIFKFCTTSKLFKKKIEIKTLIQCKYTDPIHLSENHLPEITFPQNTLGRNCINPNVHFPERAHGRNYISLNVHLAEITFS